MGLRAAVKSRFLLVKQNTDTGSAPPTPTSTPHADTTICSHVSPSSISPAEVLAPSMHPPAPPHPISSGAYEGGAAPQRLAVLSARRAAASDEPCAAHRALPAGQEPGHRLFWQSSTCAAAPGREEAERWRPVRAGSGSAFCAQGQRRIGWAGLLSTRPTTLAVVGTARLRAAGRRAAGCWPLQSCPACAPFHPRPPSSPPPLFPTLAHACPQSPSINSLGRRWP
jgi:hypothetical protein